MRRFLATCCGKREVSGLCLAAIIVACKVGWAQQPARPCPDEFTKLRLEIIHDKEVQETDPFRVRNAMLELGERRCVAAVDDLVGLLTFRLPFSKEAKPLLQRVFTGTHYPATSALGQIGKPALPALVEVIETNDAASLESKNARWTVRAIFRFHREAADKFLQASSAKAATPEAKRRLLHALQTAEEDFRSD
jgi:hypothetical protein